ncbi:DNA polymerase III subunit delta' C-terminal domain-containing protein [Candidatus Erwinia haradaeae]|uniref:DNA polymerase III subunit delta' n=1 Tax=Candidatus Erwinia haradaeae TaxID=1922217 RepID=A0A451DP64_9GAMM|nr:DNA polymerase III subunit delta' C-terminal domain-containing protein [Candidatus Erwinia haradaeae]VFP88493.1 DNA polymerase III subunit delta' [Candidatus Erwinia haradaeae]
MHWYPWLNDSYRQILTQYILNRGHHALLIQSVPGIGSKLLVRAIERWLMCHQPQEIKSCRKCHSCQLMISGNHPDLYHLESQKGQNTIGIDSVRKIKEKLYHHASLGGAKVCCLLEAHQLTDSASNALLKVIEEPPANTWFVLYLHDSDYLLETLRNRCVVWKLSVPDKKLSLMWLHRHHPSDMQKHNVALRLSFGAPVKALELLSESCWKHRLQICNAFFKAIDGDILSLLPILYQNNTIRCIEWLCSLLLDAAKWTQGAMQFISNIDQTSLVIDIAKRLPINILNDSMRQWMICRYRLLTISGINCELLLTEQLLQWEYDISHYKD